MRVLLADDHGLFRAGIASLLRAWGHDVVGEASTGREAVSLTHELRPDLVLMDIAMPELDGLAATHLITEGPIETTIVILTVSEHEDHLFEAIKAGAHGYLLKGMSENDFSGMLAGVESGDAPLSPGLASKMLREFGRLANHGGGCSRTEELTPREREVLELVAAGKKNREIATALYITENTVSYHVKNIFTKLHLRNRAEATAYAVQARLARESRENHQFG